MADPSPREEPAKNCEGFLWTHRYGGGNQGGESIVHWPSLSERTGSTVFLSSLVRLLFNITDKLYYNLVHIAAWY